MDTVWESEYGTLSSNVFTITQPAQCNDHRSPDHPTRRPIQP